MKKLFSLVLFSLVAVLGLSLQNVSAAEGDIELYPYDQLACLEASTDCTRTKVGDSNWDVSFNGYNYNVVNGNARYAVDFDDANSNGMIDATEMPSNSWSSFGGIIVNDTNEEVIIETANRTDLTGAVHRIYVYFDENGKLAMFEDHWVTAHWVYNDGDAVTPDWRLATQAEIDAAQALLDDGDENTNPDPDVIKEAKIRIALDDVDTDGYVLEELAGLNWYAADAADPGTTPTDWTTDDWSTILDYNPNYVVLPAGWTVLGLGTLDRDGSNAKTLDFIKSLPAALAADADAMEIVYEDQPAWFTGLAAEDDDPVSAGVNIVVDYQSVFELPATIEAAWLDMFDGSGNIINTEENLDFSVVISQDGVDLETINYTWDGSAYTASASQTVIDEDQFGTGYLATYSVTTPEGDVHEVEVDIVVGVFPPRFEGVMDRYVDEGLFVDVLEGITADDGYGNDVTDTIEVMAPANWNPYNPQPGSYTFDIEFTHNIFYAGVAAELIVDGDAVVWDGQVNRTDGINTAGGAVCVYTDAAVFAAASSGWGTVMVLVGADGKVDEIYDRYTWEHTTSTGTVVEDGVLFAAWQASVVIEEGGYIVAAHGSTHGTQFRDENLAYDADTSITFPTEDFSYDIVTTEQFVINVDDTTDPLLVVVDDEFMVEVNEYATPDEAILANVVAFDFFDAVDDLAVYVSNNGGLDLAVAGTYTVEVTVEDLAGNMAMVSFDIMVVEAPVVATPADVQAAIDALSATTDAEVQAVEDALAALSTLTPEEIQALIDALPEDEVGATNATAIVSGVVAALVGLGGAVFLSIKKPF